MVTNDATILRIKHEILYEVAKLAWNDQLEDGRDDIPYKISPGPQAFYFESTYKIKANEWQKVRGEGTVVFEGKNRTAELHWYEADGEKVDMKVKRWLDEG